MATNYSGGEFGGKSVKIMRLKNLRSTARDDMSNINNGELVDDQDHYHTGTAASVPFTWESEPGTPKANFRLPISPILTPPPSYFSPNYCYSNSKTHLVSHNSSSSSSSTTTNFLNTIFKRLSKPTNTTTLHPSLSSASSSSSSSCSSAGTGSPTRRLSFLSRDEEEEEEEESVESPVSTLSFFGRGGANNDNKGCFPKLVKVFTKDCK